MTARALRRLLGVCFALSGAAALIYQVAWVRLLTLALGHTVAAASTVLAAFMGGLAIGAWAAGRIPARWPPTLAMYAALELLIAAIAIALPHLLAGFDPLLVSAYADGTAPVGFAITRVAVSAVLIGVPAAAMGATYPLVVAWLARREREHARDARLSAAMAGTLYATNSAGAAAGALAAGFWLVEAFGIRGTTWVAVVLNVVAAALAWWLQRHADFPLLSPRSGSRLPTAAGSAKVGRPMIAGFAAAISGFAALVYEVAWTRLLALILGPTTYAFAAMAAAFITGIALGSSLGVRLSRRSTTLSFWLAAMLVATAASTIVAAWFAASRMPLIIAREVAANADAGSLLAREAVGVILLLLPASVSLGATFTLALATASSDSELVARQTAHVYTSNTIGAVGGALAAGFLFVPRLGLQATFLGASIVLAIAGLGVACGAEPSSRRWVVLRALPLVAAGVATMVAFGVPAWDRDLITSGAYKYARQISEDDFEWSLRAGHLEYYGEGAAGTVTVRRLAGSRSLAIDGKVDASNAGDMLTQRLLGLLPTMLHPNPREALVIGLGSGVTADAVLASGDVSRLDIVEISPEVVEASAYFARENHDVLQKPGVRLLIGDGRSHLRLSTRQYDVIVSEPSNPWMAGVAALFTREFFEAARAKLRSGGIFCQWTHTYEIADADLRSIVRTFASVFPDGTMWLAGEADMLLIGSVTTGIDERVTAVASRSQVGRVPALLEDLGIPPPAAPFVLLSLYAGGPRELALFADNAAVQTDDRMPLEFSAARAMYAPPPGNAATLRSIAARAALPDAAAAIVRSAGLDDWIARGDSALRAEAFELAHESFRRAAAIDSQSARALRGSTDAASGLRRMVEETEWLRTLASAEPANAAVRVEVSHAMAALGDAEGAIAAAMDAVRIAPASPAPLEQLASIFSDLGDAAQLMPVADELTNRFPHRHEGRYYRAAALFLAGRAGDAERELRMLLSAAPPHAGGNNLLGIVCAARGDRDCARQSFMRSLDLNARDPSVYTNLGNLSLEAGDADAAMGFFREALAVDPLYDAAKRGLEDATTLRVR
jgi:spermidine synthase